MITIEDARSAMLADQPWVALDGLVRAEMAAGRKVKDIAAEFRAIYVPLSDTPGLSDDSEDALGDTLDALTGNCHSDSCYKDPPNTSLPTEAEITQLPRWARVAFAARCARRVLPLYLTASVHVEWGSRVRRAVDTATVAASAAWADSVEASKAAAGADGLGGFPTVAATCAAQAVVEASAEAWAGDDVPFVIGAQNESVRAVQTIDITRRDFDHLAELAEWQRWTDDTPVPPEVFGPLWPEGAPAGWPADPDMPRRDDLPLELLSAARVLEQMTEDETVNLFNAINAYYIARTGDRLTVEDLRPLVANAVLVEV